MLQNKKKWTMWKVILLCTLVLLTAVGIPSATTLAKTTDKQRELLNTTIKYCDTMKASKYTEGTWKKFQKELKEAKAIYKKTTSTSKVYSAARNDLEEVKANLAFVASAKLGNALPYRTLTPDQIVNEMGAGWNLGNTMDGHTGFTPTETLWQTATTTKKFIKAVHDSGFNTIRVPVTWGTKIDDANGYTLNEKWISRVQDIVDYAISQDMYVIINVHHDGAEQAGWLRVAAEDIDPVYEKFEAVWRNIAERFKDYDEHLIFESMNEITGGNASTPEQDIKVIKNLNQIFVNLVRSTRSNNSERWLSVPGRYTNIDTTTNKLLGFKMPKDTVKKRLFVSVHYYDYAFGLLESMDTTTYSSAGATGLVKMCQPLVDQFTSKGIPVILGEYGAVNKNNTVERAYHYEALTKVCQKDGIVACAWDSGDFNFDKEPADYSFSLFDRNKCEVIYPDIVNAIMRGTYLPVGAGDNSDLVKNPTITNIKDFTLSAKALSMKLGDSKKVTTVVNPSTTNDVVLWKTKDPTVATVFNGNVRGRGIGTTTITAFTQSGSFKKDIKVTVVAKKSANPCTGIKTSEALEIDNGKYVYMKVNLAPAVTDDYVTYKSSNEDVATVSTLGKIVGCSEGTANITITASNGLTKVVKVNVKKSETLLELPVALNVFYNDDKLGYYLNEFGEPIEITGDGQYSITFDCSKDLSENAAKAGVNSLTNITAIYIKDHNCTLGETTTSPLTSCKIKYDEIIVDGVKLTITQKDPKNAIKASGILDTNDPINSWDGSFVKEVSVNNHVLNITGVTAPKKITVTFTISDFKFVD